MSEVRNAITQAVADGRYLLLSGSIADITTRDHDLLNGLGDDDHTQYTLLAGRSGGQTIYGSTQASENLTLYSTSNATRGLISLVAETLAGGDCKIDLSSYYYSPYDIDIPELIPRDNVRSTGSAAISSMFVRTGLYVRHATGNPQLGLYNADLTVSSVMTLNATTGVVSVSGTQWRFGAAPSAPGASGSERWGDGATAAGTSSTAIGYAATASGQNAFAGGANSLASQLGAFALGNSAQATQVGATALGWNAKATGQGAFAMGALTQVSGTSSVGVAYIGAVSGNYSVAIGPLTNVSFNYSVAIGSSSTCTKANQFVSGSSSGPIVEVVFGNGVTHTTPQSQTLFTTTSGSGTDKAGTNYVVQPGAGTGAGAGGDFIVKTATPGGSGSGLNSYTTALTIDDTQKALFAAEVEIDGDLNHDGTNVGFYGTAPVPKASAYTQTYSTTTKTHAARTAPGAGAGSGADTTTFSGAQCDALVADQQNTAKVLNALIDDLQALGLVS